MSAYHPRHGVGINIGSSSVKIVVLEDGRVARATVTAHEGDFAGTVRRLLERDPLPKDAKVLATGAEGRRLLAVNNIPEPLCIEAALRGLGLRADAVASLGGEIFQVYSLADGRIVNNFAGNKCASGTGEFFRQQLGRMGMTLDDIRAIPPTARLHPLASRCSVFMKSDCTHKLNKGEATKADIALSLSQVMAAKVADFLKRGRIESGRVVLIGGVTRNPHILRFLGDLCPNLEFVVPAEAEWFEAYGAALLAPNSGSPLPPPERLLRPAGAAFASHPPLASAEHLVTRLPSRRGTPKPGREYILGVDGGSTTTKAALVDLETAEIVASHYGRTHGDPVRALKECLAAIREQMRGVDHSIVLAATTGSSREILGVFLGTPGVYNEIIAHATGTTFFRPEIDTIFEIGGQDAKYVLLNNGVPVDYAMNEACSAGTGSFLEESCAGDLGIADPRDIGPIALRAKAPLKFGEQCSAFINSDIRKAIQYGASREDIAAGIVASIVSNYLNRVVGNRTIGDHVVLQGGVALNPAVPLAFAMLMNRPIVIPPDPELLGCFGVALLARQKLREGLLAKGRFDLDRILRTEIVHEQEFVCRACENLCPVRMLNVDGHRSPFGGRCSKYTNIRRKGEAREGRDWVERRRRMLFEESAPPKDAFVRRRTFTVGVPRAFSVHSLWPLYAWFFHNLGIETVLSEEVRREGMARTEGSYCFPAEIAHGAVQDLLGRTDYIFTPHFRDMESLEDDVHANFCPITQSFPYYIRQAFPELPPSRFLAPVVSFKFGFEKALEGFYRMTDPLGLPRDEVRAAFTDALERQKAFWKAYRDLGRQVLEEARREDRAVIAILGRPYNAFTADANMGIPKKFTSRGHTVVPFDMLPFGDEEITPNMYWYYGQQDLKAAVLLRDEPNLFITYITNFSCAPDSFILHYIKWFMGPKPFLVLELDSHSADAGVDTRVEAFLDIIEGYRSRAADLRDAPYDNGLRFVNDGKTPIHVWDARNHRRIEVFRNPRLRLLLANMGQLSTEIMAVILRSAGINAEALPLPDTRTLQLARAQMSGKECLPSQLVLGSVLQFIASERYRKDETYLVFVPITTGPCRTGQYYVYYEQVFRRLRLENVVVMTLSADRSYSELGPGINRLIWKGVLIGDYMKDIQTALRTCAQDPASALRRYEEIWRDLVERAGRGIRRLEAGLGRVSREIRRIPLARRLHDIPKVLVVGEIYVRRDDFAVDELVGLFAKHGIMAKVAGVSEWLWYVDHVRLHDITKRLRLLPWWRRPFSRPFRELLAWHAVNAYKKAVDRRIRSVLDRTGLIPHTPHDMEEILRNAQTHFVSDELYSEISVSSGVAATAMLQDFSGIVNISPFGCLIGRVIEGLVTPWSRGRRFPVISVEIDGSALPPTLVNKLEIFILNALRFRQNIPPHALVESPPEHPAAPPAA